MGPLGTPRVLGVMGLNSSRQTCRFACSARGFSGTFQIVLLRTASDARSIRLKSASTHSAAGSAVMPEG
jgi:hypothetical protein